VTLPATNIRTNDGSDATLNRAKLREAGVLAVSVAGGPGCGKSTLIDTTLLALVPHVGAGVIACDEAFHRDAGQGCHHGAQVVRVSTGHRGTPDASDIKSALGGLDLGKIDLLFIENVGTLVGPVALDFGQEVTASVFSVAGGHDRADRDAELVRAAGIIILNKTDLLAAVAFNLDEFVAGVRRHNARAAFCGASALRGDGLEPWFAWLKEAMAARSQAVVRRSV
jgi:hydrogenase nickel incorporation protein HypB